MSVSEWSGRPDERESPETVAGVAAPGRTPATEGDRTPEGRTDDLRAEMAAIAHAPSKTLLGRDPISSCPSPHEAVERAVDALIAAGYRLVSEDEATVDRLAGLLTDWFEGRGRAEFWDAQDMARAAVRALREAGRDA